METSKRISGLRIGLMTVVIAFAASASPALAKETTMADLRLIEDKFRSLNTNDEAEVLALLKKASDGVASLPQAKGKKLDGAEVKELVELLRVSKKYDKFNRIVDDNSELIAANRKAIGFELKKLAPADAGDIVQTIDIVLSSDESSDFSQDMDQSAASSRKSRRAPKK